MPQIFEWCILDHLALTAIARRLDEAGAPRPGGQRWSGSTVDAILKNPKYTGYLVWGRSKRNGPGRSTAALKVPADQWLWSPDPAHPALIDLATWKEAQDAGKKRGKVRDRETPAARDARAPLRGRIRHNQCHRVLTPRPRAGNPDRRRRRPRPAGRRPPRRRPVHHRPARGPRSPLHRPGRPDPVPAG